MKNTQTKNCILRVLQGVIIGAGAILPGISGGGSWVPGAEGSPGGWVGSGCLPSGGLHRLQLASGAEEGPGRSGRA